MKKYDYRKQIRQDVKDYLEENLDYIKAKAEGSNISDVLYDELRMADSVTGNASGSYTFNGKEAKEYVEENYDLAIKAYKDFDCLETLATDIEEEHFELIDVTIRLHLLGEAIAYVLENKEVEV